MTDTDFSPYIINIIRVKNVEAESLAPNIKLKLQQLCYILLGNEMTLKSEERIGSLISLFLESARKFNRKIIGFKKFDIIDSSQEKEIRVKTVIHEEDTAIGVSLTMATEQIAVDSDRYDMKRSEIKNSPAVFYMLKDHPKVTKWICANIRVFDHYSRPPKYQNRLQPEVLSTRRNIDFSKPDLDPSYLGTTDAYLRIVLEDLAGLVIEDIDGKITEMRIVEIPDEITLSQHTVLERTDVKIRSFYAFITTSTGEDHGVYIVVEEKERELLREEKIEALAKRY